MSQGLSATFAADLQKQMQWKAFLRKTGADPTLELELVVNDLSQAMRRILDIPWSLGGDC